VTGKLADRSVNFVVDTNSSLTVFDKSLISLLGPSLGKLGVETTGSFMITDQFQPPPMTIGTLEVQSGKPVICIDLTELKEAAGIAFDGVLGMDVLSQYVVDIDFDAGELRFLAETPPAIKEQRTSLPLDTKTGVPTIRVDQPALCNAFRIDTGSSGSCVERPIFESLLHSQLLDLGPDYAAATPTGSVTAKLGLLKRLEVGPYSHESLLVESGPMSLLGLSYLSRFNWTFDFPCGVAYMQPSAKYSEPDQRGTSGLAIKCISSKLIVVGIKPGSPSAGLVSPGDELISINDQEVGVSDMFQVRELLTAGPAAKVQLGLLRAGQTLSAEIVTRDRLIR
jgi:hypothetical protein